MYIPATLFHVLKDLHDSSTSIPHPKDQFSYCACLPSWETVVPFVVFCATTVNSVNQSIS